MSNILTEEEFFKKLSEKIGESIESLKAELEDVVKEVKQDDKFKEFNEEQLRNLARNKYGMRKTRELSVANLVPWEGAIIGVGDLIDTVAKQKRLTEAAFKVDPMKTMKGWVHDNVLVMSDNDGKPLYPKTDSNDKFKRTGKPLPEHSWLRSIYLFARPIDPKTKQPGVPKVAKMTINGNTSIDMSGLPVMTSLKFKAINKTNDEDIKINEYSMNFSVFTKFEKTTIKDFPPMEQLLPSITTHYESLGGLEVYHQKNESNPRRWIVTEGSVANLSLEPNAKTGNLFMILSDESLIFGGGTQTGVMCWIPTDRGIVMDFGIESRVYLVGKTSRGKAKDPATGQILEGVPGDVSLNVYGLYAPELFKVSPEIQKISEKSVIPQPTEKEEW